MATLNNVRRELRERFESLKKDPNAELKDHIKEFLKHIFRARGFLPENSAKAKEELLWALNELKIQEELGAPVEDTRIIKQFIEDIVEAIDLKVTSVAITRFDEFFSWIAGKMFGPFI